MQTQRVNRTDAEKVFIVIKNVDVDSITTGFGVRHVGGAAAEIASTDGNQSVKSGLSPLFVGIAFQDIASNGVGLVQSWGYVNSIAYSAEANKTVGVTGLANAFLKAGAVLGTFTSTQVPEAISTGGFKYVLAVTTVNISGTPAYGSAIVRAL